MEDNKKYLQSLKSTDLIEHLKKNYKNSIINGYVFGNFLYEELAKYYGVSLELIEELIVSDLWLGNIAYDMSEVIEVNQNKGNTIYEFLLDNISNALYYELYPIFPEYDELDRGIIICSKDDIARKIIENDLQIKGIEYITNDEEIILEEFYEEQELLYVFIKAKVEDEMHMDALLNFGKRISENEVALLSLVDINAGYGQVYGTDDLATIIALLKGEKDLPKYIESVGSIKLNSSFGFSRIESMFHKILSETKEEVF